MAETTRGSPESAAHPEETTAEAAKPSLASKLSKAFQTSPSKKDAVKTRRRFVGIFTGGFLLTNFLMFLRFFFPRTIFEPNRVFRIGAPSDYGIGVDTKFQKSQRIWVVRGTDRLFVIFARCTHLGCTPDWKESESKFKCPCHGSGYDPEGINYEGPAPRPMDRARVELNAEGQIVVDTSILFKEEKGKATQFNDERAYVVV